MAEPRRADRPDAEADVGSRGSAGEPGSQAGPAGARSDGMSSLELDGLIHERVRLGIVSALSVGDNLSFTELRDLLGTTDGNLSAHARKLEDAGYVECRKSFACRVPRTEYRLTALGRDRLREYLAHMEALIRRTREG